SRAFDLRRDVPDARSLHRYRVRLQRRSGARRRHVALHRNLARRCHGQCTCPGILPRCDGNHHAHRRALPERDSGDRPTGSCLTMTIDGAPVIARPSIPSQAEDVLRRMILDGTLSPGERLNEVTIAESIGISRGPLREAIKRLSGQGYLTMETHRGAFVKAYTPQEIMDLYELRSALE